MVIRYESDEIGKEEAACPKCGWTSGRLLHLKTQDSLRCGKCRKQGSVVSFMKVALKKLRKRGCQLHLACNNGKYSFEHDVDCDCNYCTLMKKHSK